MEHKDIHNKVSIRPDLGLLDELNAFLDAPAQPTPTIISGELIFTEKDILDTTNILSRMLRAIFVDKGITKQYLSEKYRIYATNVLGDLPSKVSTGNGNLLNAIKRDAVSFKKFYEVMVLVLGFDLDFAVSISDDMSRKTYRYGDVMNAVTNKRG